MKRFLLALIIVTLLLASSCGGAVSTKESPTKQLTTSAEETAPRKEYIGNYSVEPVYQELMKFEDCKDPEVLCQMLFDLYCEEFTYVKLDSVTDENGYADYASPYEDFLCQSLTLYNTLSEKSNSNICTDTYLFFKSYDEAPSFMMDANATYIVGSYKISNFEDGTHCHRVSGWVLSDLFMCLHKYIDHDEEGKEFMSGGVRYMDFYLDFENLIIDSLGTNTGSITKTESLSPKIEILSVDIIGPSFHDLEVTYRIKNISPKKGRVSLTCSGYTYQDNLHFNDENYENDYREDGKYTCKIRYCGDVEPVTFTISYGYGNFDADTGWEKELSTTISLLYVDGVFFEKTNGVIGSSSIPSEEIHPLYFEDTYVGAWTTNPSGNLIEIN